MILGPIYIALLVLGTAYAIIAGALGWLHDLGGGDIHVDVSGHLDAGHAHPITGTTAATFITGFGAGGTLAHYAFGWGRAAGLLFATACGLLLAIAAFGVLDLLFSQTQAGSEFALDDMIGREAEVITPIPEGGAGEIAYLVKGQREHATARCVDGTLVPKGRLVVIDRIAGPTAWVRPKG